MLWTRTIKADLTGPAWDPTGSIHPTTEPARQAPGPHQLHPGGTLPCLTLTYWAAGPQLTW